MQHQYEATAGQRKNDPDRCQKSGTEEGIHPTRHVSESWHVNTAEKTCNRGWGEQGLAGCRGVTTRQDYICNRQTQVSSLITSTQLTMVSSYTSLKQYFHMPKA